MPNSRTRSKKSVKVCAPRYATLPCLNLLQTKKRRQSKGISIFDILGRLFLLWFTIYSLSVCPDDVELRSPVCRALTEYRRLVLEPFVYPPIRAAFEHPSIAPHIQRAQPYYNRAVETTKPLVLRGKYEWRTRVVPRVHWFQLRARPYVRRIKQQYNATLGPYVWQASDVLVQYKVKAEPYMHSTMLEARQKWEKTKPYVRPLLQRASGVPGVLVRLIGRPLGDARREWVDPQVAKIWAAVVEKGQTDTMNVTAASTTIESQDSSVPGSTASTLSTPSTESPISMSTLEDIPALTSASPPTSSSISAASTLSTSNSPEGSSLADSSISEPAKEFAASASSIIQSSLTPNSISSEVSSEPSPTKVESWFAEEEEPVEDLTEFLAEIGLNDGPSSDSPPESSPEQPAVPQETEEDEEELLRLKAIETAEKRADIESRHTQWEIDLEKFGKAQRKVVRASLNRLREAAVEEARAPNAAIRMHVDGLLQEAEKSLKSLKAYTRKLATENKSEIEKITNWENVVNKVDRKFTKRVEEATDGIREWWSAYVDKEVGEVNKVIVAQSIRSHHS